MESRHTCPMSNESEKLITPEPPKCHIRKRRYKQSIQLLASQVQQNSNYLLGIIQKSPMFLNKYSRSANKGCKEQRHVSVDTSDINSYQTDTHIISRFSSTEE